MPLCVVCHLSEGAPVCADDRNAMARMLAAIPDRLARLSTAALVPGTPEPGPRVSVSRAGSPMPPRETTLSLLADGTPHVVSPDVPAMLNPRVRRWRTTGRRLVRRVVVTDGIADVVEREEEITDWHRELVVDYHATAAGVSRCRCGKVHPLTDRTIQPVLVPEDDQIGVLPPREWLDVQVRRLRRLLGHHVPARTITRLLGHSAPAPGWAAPDLPAADLLPLIAVPGGAAAAAFISAVRQTWRTRGMARLGLLGELPHDQRPDDPLAEELETRFGEPPRSMAAGWDVKYLLTHLDQACDLDLGIGAFAGELRALTAEMVRALGEEPDLKWLGRCPASLADPETGQWRRCGAGLWRDMTSAQVVCPRCHTPWDVCGPAANTLAREIRQAWPIDRRRRYTTDEANDARRPTCGGCGRPVIVEWRDVTALGERTRWWQPVRSRCEKQCDEAGRVL